MVKARDLKVSNKSVVLKGVEYKLAFDMNAIGMLEEFYGTVDEVFKNIGSGKMRDTHILLWSMINAGFDDESNYVSIREVGTLFTLDDIVALSSQVNDVFTESMPEEEKVTKKKTPRQRKS